MTETEIDITDFFENEDPWLYFGSVATHGANAGRDTWNAAKERAGTLTLLKTPREFDEFRSYVQEFGAWEAEEINGWSEQELNALLIQMISGDINEAGLDMSAPDWEEYTRGVEAGRYSGRIYHGDDEKIYYYIGC